jgi:photosystem II stability/assembly factor-like uncharacterized protein
VPTQGLLKSATLGAPWQPSGQGLPHLGDLREEAIAADPTTAGHLFVGWSPLFTPAGGLAESTDGGASWTQIQPSGNLCRLDVSSLQIEPLSPLTMYGTGVLQTECDSGAPACSSFKTTDGGASWSCLPFEGVNLVIAPSDPNIVYAFFIDFDAVPRISRSGDGGASWSAADTGIPTRVLEMRALAVDPTNAHRLLAAGSDGSVWLSTTDGSSWAVASHGLPSGPDFVAIDPRTPTTFYATSGALGVYRSLNSGQNWHPFIGGLPPLGFPYAEIGPLLFSPDAADTLFVAVTGAGIFSATP